MRGLIQLKNPEGKIALRDMSMIFKYVVYLIDKKEYLKYIFLDMNNNFIRNAEQKDLYQN